MTVDLTLLRKEAELLKASWNHGELRYSDWVKVLVSTHPNPGAVAERCIALIEEHERFLAKRFLLFGCNQYYPAGGTEDMIGAAFASVEDAKAAAVGDSSDDVWIFDVLTHESIPVSWNELHPELAAKINGAAQ